MIDLHCHILPGIDDGPETMDEAVAMCRMAAADGVTVIVATTHFRPGTFEPAAERIASLTGELQKLLNDGAVPLSVLTGAEISVTAELPRYLEQHPFLTINGNGRYFLAEFPPDMVPPRWSSFLTGISAKGVIPVLAHPERNHQLVRNLDEIEAYVGQGGLVQITAGSLTGDMGPAVRAVAVEMVRRNLCQVIASDGHSAGWRPPLLSRAFSIASEIVGPERARTMVHDAPAAIIAGDRVSVLPPVRMPAKKGWLARLLGS